MPTENDRKVETPEGPVQLPATFHFTACRTVALGKAGHAIFDYGHEVELTHEMVEASRGRDGRSSLLERIRTGDGIHPGAWPPERGSRLLPGSFEFRDARERARQEAHREPDPEQRAALLAKVREDYGSEVTSRTLTTRMPVSDHG
jgi:hypothetical protein